MMAVIERIDSQNKLRDAISRQDAVIAQGIVQRALLGPRG
jgi:hypothetical protein